ncbi:type III secretion system effector ExoY, adenylate cyclase [Xenorhabdus mauleonii]|uniref:Adenylate cyclase ExoY n=1 Tax=Xenorhabdus mauleonii TaxID=351675 RepID=A0A1I3NCN5_9GAMM|nr:anthrax toxin-like adenylyl cyclase domain-containing protein [Xenorhabdus mauleonii]PHM45715.1 type III secretion system effector ExoY, adenylate cyclase [Xenorhabdus mauleonii]SFJ06952.1 adenylate cyclase ExoY [Xenorhabdus mauleonii]
MQIEHNIKEETSQSPEELVKGLTGFLGGIDYSHVIKLQRYAAINNCIVGIRPVESLAGSLIRDGYPTKSLDIKGKSSNWGPQAGFICENQLFSKLEGTSGLEIEYFNQKVQDCINARYATSIPLKITRGRLQELMGERLIMRNSNSPNSNDYISKRPSGNEYSFKLVPVDSNKKQEEQYLKVLYKNKPIKVLAPNEQSKPLTADYDLLLIGVHIADYGVNDRIIKHDKNAGIYPSYCDNNMKNQEKQPDMGVVTRRIIKIINEINVLIAGNNPNLIHHGADTENPYTDPATNYPAIFVLPKNIAPFNMVCVIQNDDELFHLIQKMRDEHYYTNVNPSWPSRFAKIRNQTYTDARNLFKRVPSLPSFLMKNRK